jgi:hypothetical protein
MGWCRRNVGTWSSISSCHWTHQHNWLRIKNIFRYLQGTTHYLTYSCKFREIWTPISSEYTDVGYLNDPHNVYLHGRSVTPLMSSNKLRWRHLPIILEFKAVLHV